MTNLMTPVFFEGIPEYASTADDAEFHFSPDDFSDMMMEAVYILDFQKQCFRFVSGHDFFLCGHSREEAMSLGYEFYRKVIHPEDISLFAGMHGAILQRLQNSKEQLDLMYFSCTFRIGGYPQTGKKPDWLMAYHKLKPVYANGRLRFGLCMLTCSAIKTSGNLRLYYTGGLDYEEYLLTARKWRKQKMPSLTDRQRRILQLAKEGDTGKEIADRLRVSVKTVNADRTAIFENFGVTSIEQAIVYATNHMLLFNSTIQTLSEEKQPDRKQKRSHTLTPDILKRIQAGLDSGQSVNSLAKEVDFSETAIRKAIQQGKLKKQS